MIRDLIAYENAYAWSMLEEIGQNEFILQILGELSQKLKHDILLPLKQNPALVKKLSGLAVYNSRIDKPFGALFPEANPSDLMDTEAGQLMLLDAIELTLDHAANPKSNVMEVFTLLKAIDNMAYVYANPTFLEAFPTMGNRSHYLSIADMVATTNEELDARTTRKAPMEATTYGVGTDIGKDLVCKGSVTGATFSGKAQFIMMDAKARILYWLETYNKEKNDKEKRTFWERKFAYYGISKHWAENLGELSEKDELFFAQWKTYFERLVQDLPQIATPSNSSSKSFVLYLEKNYFIQENEKFDLDKGLVIANCLMAYFVSSGHHSVLEIREIWNRTLDYLGIKDLENNAQGLARRLPDDIIKSSGIWCGFHNPSSQYINDPNMAEKRLPYGTIGKNTEDYLSFLHPQYIREVQERIKVRLSEASHNLDTGHDSYNFSNR